MKKVKAALLVVLAALEHNGGVLVCGLHQQVMQEERLANARVAQYANSRRLRMLDKEAEHFLVKVDIVFANKQRSAKRAQSEDVNIKVDDIVCNE